jgi:hypothetical protein
VVDSAGITWVRVRDLRDVEAPAWALDTVYSTEARGVELFRVDAGRILPDGRVVVSDYGTSELLLLDPDGHLLRRIGGPGEGPGEFRRIVTVHVEPSGFSAYDARLGRWSFFDTDGDLLRTEPLEPPRPAVGLRPLARAEGEGILAVFGSIRAFSDQPIHRDTTPLLHYSTLASSPDTLGLWPTLEWAYTTEGGAMRYPVAFFRHLVSFGRGPRAVVGDTDTLVVSVFDATGREQMRIHGPGSRLPTTEEEADRVRRDRAGPPPETGTDPLRDAILRAPYRETYPAFDDAIIDAGGRVWIGATARVDESRRRWVIFDPAGRVVGHVFLPTEARVLDATGDRLFLRTQGPLDVQRVELYRVGRVR